MAKQSPSVSVIVPFYNEPKIIETYKKLRKELLSYKIPFQIVFVSDGSKKEIISSLKKIVVKDKHTLLIEYFPNKGRGFAVQQGFKKASGDYLLFIDSDLDIHEKHIKRIITRLNTSDVAIGSKAHKRSHVNTRFVRKIASPLLNAIVRVGLGTGVHDHHVGLKGFRREVVATILPKVTQKRWMFDAEMIKLVKDHKFSIGEEPISMTYGTGPLRFSYARYFLDILLFILFFRLRRIKFRIYTIIGLSKQVG